MNNLNFKFDRKKKFLIKGQIWETDEKGNIELAKESILTLEKALGYRVSEEKAYKLIRMYLEDNEVKD